MPTIHHDNNPSSRIATGDAILAAAAQIKTGAIAAPLKAFASAHKAYSAAAVQATKAGLAVEAQEAKIGAADATQDAALDALARALIGDNAPKGNPFKPYGVAAPSEVAKMGYAKEAKAAQALAGKVARDASKSKSSKDKAKALDTAAKSVIAVVAAKAQLEQARTKARGARDGLGQGWETSLAALKLLARAADLHGGGIYDALFTRDAPKKKAKKKVPAKNAGGAKGSTAPPGAAAGTNGAPSSASPATA